MYPALMSVIFKSVGAELLGALSTACIYSFPKVENEVAARAELTAAFWKKFLLFNFLKVLARLGLYGGM